MKKIKKFEIANRKTTQSTETAINKTLLLSVAIGVIAVALIVMVLLIWQYGNFAVARINGMPIRRAEVTQQAAGSLGFFTAEYPHLSQDEVKRIVREEVVRDFAFLRLFEYYARQFGLPAGRNENPNEIIEGVITTITNDPALFARYEVHMPIVPEPRDIEPIAAAILDRIRAGEDFDTLMRTYGEDPGMANNPQGYTFTRGFMDPPFEEATAALEIGEISGLVRGHWGYHIIKRIDPISHAEVLDPMGRSYEDIAPEELLGARHILIAADDPVDMNQLMREAIVDGFVEKIDANIRYLPRLNRVPVD